MSTAVDTQAPLTEEVIATPPQTEDVVETTPTTEEEPTAQPSVAGDEEAPPQAADDIPADAYDQLKDETEPTQADTTEAEPVDEAEVQRLAEEAEARRLADERQAESKRLEDEAESQRQADEAETKRLEEEAEAQRLADEAAEDERKRLDELEIQFAAQMSELLEEEASIRSVIDGESVDAYAAEFAEGAEQAVAERAEREAQLELEALEAEIAQEEEEATEVPQLQGEELDQLVSHCQAIKSSFDAKTLMVSYLEGNPEGGVSDFDGRVALPYYGGAKRSAASHLEELLVRTTYIKSMLRLVEADEEADGGMETLVADIDAMEAIQHSVQQGVEEAFIEDGFQAFLTEAQQNVMSVVHEKMPLGAKEDGQGFALAFELRGAANLPPVSADATVAIKEAAKEEESAAADGEDEELNNNTTSDKAPSIRSDIDAADASAKASDNGSEDKGFLEAVMDVVDGDEDEKKDQTASFVIEDDDEPAAGGDNQEPDASEHNSEDDHQEATKTEAGDDEDHHGETLNPAAETVSPTEGAAALPNFSENSDAAESVKEQREVGPSYEANFIQAAKQYIEEVGEEAAIKAGLRGRLTTIQAKNAAVIQRIHDIVKEVAEVVSAGNVEVEAECEEIKKAFDVEMRNLDALERQLKQTEDEQMFHVRRGTFAKPRGTTKELTQEARTIRERKRHDALVDLVYKRQVSVNELEEEIKGLKKDLRGVGKEAADAAAQLEEMHKDAEQELSTLLEQRNALQEEKDDLTDIKANLMHTLQRVKHGRKEGTLLLKK